jgi:hypothetical protein
MAPLSMQKRMSVAYNLPPRSAAMISEAEEHKRGFVLRQQQKTNHAPIISCSRLLPDTTLAYEPSKHYK